MRLRLGELLAGAGAVLLVILLSAEWARPEFRVRTTGGVDLSSPLQNANDTVAARFANQYAETGWSALGVVLVVCLLVSIIGAAALVVLTVVERDTPVLPVVVAVCTAAWSIIIAVVLLLRLTLFQPGLEIGWADRDVNILGPAWFGLLALVLIAAGSWLTLRDDRLASPLSVPPEVPVRPAPPVVT
ncbi:hypothetical protein DSM112329_02343 [Paraconexibacter sp. AEG42_29]|uniref:Uncharacterized protein n=2 Tax=Paraconexibacter sp. AEG42_29 TaxID=2997339 RepID=A0AAU7AV42_9ACTN